MRAGELRDRIEIYSVDPNTGDGQHIARVWGKVEVPAGSEVFETEEGARPQVGTVTIRALSSVARTMRIRYGLRVFEIQTVSDDRKGTMVLSVSELRLQ